jgi:integrase
MPTRKLTDLFVERVKAPTGGRRVEYFDAAFPGLALRVTNRGRKSFSLHYRMHGRLRRLTLGSYPAIKPAQARHEAMAALERVRQGIDPSAEKQARRFAPSPESEAFGVLVCDYLDHHVRPNLAPTTYKETKRILESDGLATWHDRPISSITRRDVIGIIDAITTRGAKVQANRTLERLRALFRWAIEKDRLHTSPIDGMRRPTKEWARDRTLSDDELRWFWAASTEIGWPFGPLAQLLLLTAQRRDEVAGAEWPEIDLGKKIWTIPRAKAKNDREHEVQLSAAAIEVLKSLPRIGDGFLFTTTGATPVSGFSRAKERMRAAMLVAKRGELGKTAGEIPEWTLHDLRRTAATGMARLNFPPHVVDKILNHTSGAIRGVAAIYNRFAYMEERRAALEAWGRYVSNLSVPTTSAIADLGAVRRRKGLSPC